MPAKVTYYAIVDDFSTRATPLGCCGRKIDDEGRDDEAFTTNLTWEHSGRFIRSSAAMRTAEFYEITEDEANQIVERIRRSVTGEQ